MLQKLSQLFRSASTPPDTRIYAIGDVHGYDDALNRMLDRIEWDRQQRPVGNTIIVLLADYSCRGPHSAQVIERLCREREKKDGVQRIFLIGNHDHAFKMFMNADMSRRLNPDATFFLDYGGLATLHSYGLPLMGSASTLGWDSHAIRNTGIIVNSEILGETQHRMRKLMPQSHRDFYNAAQVFYELGDYFFVHAAVDPSIELGARQDERLMTGMDQASKQFPENRERIDKVIVHGHTTSRKPYSRSNQIGVDTGVYKTGILSCAVLEGKNVSFIQERTELPLYNRKSPLQPWLPAITR